MGKRHAPVTLAGTPDYLTISGQEITQNEVDISDDTNLEVSSPIVLTDDTVSIQDAAADDSTKGAATFEADDFDSASGKIDLADSVAKSVDSDVGAATPSTHAFTIAGGEGISTSGADATITVTNDSPNVDQDLWDTIDSDSGSTTADSTTDTLTVAGGAGIDTSIADDTLTVAADVGIADDKILQVDDADAADDDYAKFTANGLEGRSYSEVLGDLSGQAGAAFSFNDQDVSNVGDIALDSITNDAGSTPVEINYDLTLNRDTGAGNQTRTLKIAGERGGNTNSIAQISFYGYDDSAEYECARIDSYNESDGSAGTSMGDLRFYTQPGGSITERAHIHTEGVVDFNNQSRVIANQDTSTGQSVNSATTTIVQYDEETEDEQAEYNITNYRFTAQKGGYYLVIASLMFESSSDWDNDEYASLSLFKNGSRERTLDCRSGWDQSGLGGARNYTVFLTGSAIVYLDGASDYVDVRVYQNSGAARTVSSNEYENRLEIHKLS